LLWPSGTHADRVKVAATIFPLYDLTRQVVAKLLARSLRQMFVLAPLFGIGSVLAGLVASSWIDAPSGPAIVVVTGILFLTAWARTVWRARHPLERARG
jgi:hypothetical protein